MKDMIKLHRNRLAELTMLIECNIAVMEKMYQTHNSIIDDLTSDVGCSSVSQFVAMDESILRSKLNIMPEKERKMVLSKISHMAKIMCDILRLKDETEKMKEEADIVNNVLKFLTHNG